MFRRLTLIALTLSASTVGAQGTDIIIRRSGQKDQVLHLDDKKGSEIAARVSDQLQGAMRELKGLEIAREGNSIRFTVDSAFKGRELAARTAEAGARMAATAQASATMMARVVRSAMSQPRIGIYVNNLDSQESDKYGALISSVSPGGPADKAGLRSGDIITRIAGKSLAAADLKPEGDNDRPLPGVRLIEVVSKLPVGKAVDVDYRRGTDKRSTKVTPVEMDDTDISAIAPSMTFNARPMRVDSFGFSPAVPRNGMVSRMPLQVPGMDRNTVTLFEDVIPGSPTGNLHYAFGVSGPLSNLELVSLNEKLGSYFGTSEGVLVVNVGTKDAFGLTPGDVIVSVDGRKVTGSSQLMRILRTYEQGEEFKLQIMRQKKTETLTGKLP